MNIFDQMRRMNEKPMCSLSQQRYIRTFSVKMYIRVRIPYKFNCSLPHLPHLPQFFKHRPKLHASTYILELSTNPPRRQWLQQIRPQSRSSQTRPKLMANLRPRIRLQVHLLPDILSKLPVDWVISQTRLWRRLRLFEHPHPVGSTCRTER